MSRIAGHGDRGQFLDLNCVPDATFESELDALIIADTQVIGKLVTWTFLNNYEVTSAADGAIADGEVIAYEVSGTSYQLTVRVFSCINQNSVRFKPTCVKQLPYATGTIALQDSVIINGSTYINVDDGTSGGYGCVISKDTAGLTVDVLF